jgi:hypothetical protein
MQRVEIRVKGHLDEDWAPWLEGFAFTHTPQDETVLTGEVADQAALYGLMAKLRDLGVRLSAVDVRDAGEGASEGGHGAA